jgi:hypothetical protein
VLDVNFKYTSTQALGLGKGLYTTLAKIFSANVSIDRCNVAEMDAQLVNGTRSRVLSSMPAVVRMLALVLIYVFEQPILSRICVADEVSSQYE